MIYTLADTEKAKPRYDYSHEYTVYEVCDRHTGENVIASFELF